MSPGHDSTGLEPQDSHGSGLLAGEGDATAPLGTLLARGPGRRVHMCLHCGFPIAVYGRLLPCAHTYCLVCATDMAVCTICHGNVNRIERVARDEAAMFISPTTLQVGHPLPRSASATVTVHAEACNLPAAAQPYTALFHFVLIRSRLHLCAVHMLYHVKCFSGVGCRHACKRGEATSAHRALPPWCQYATELSPFLLLFGRASKTRSTSRATPARLIKRSWPTPRSKRRCRRPPRLGRPRRRDQLNKKVPSLQLVAGWLAPA